MFRYLTALAVVAASPASADTVVVTADRMLDVLTGRMVDRPVVVITDGRIVSVNGGAAPADARRVDLRA